MGILTPEMQRLIAEQRLGFVATVCPDGTPNLSPKGTTAVLDDDHLVFADIRSPRTVANLLANPAIEINLVDQLTRKGFRFKGTARVLSDGPEFERLLTFYRDRGSTSEKRHIVIMTVERAAPLSSPDYDTGQAEAQVVAKWRAYWDKLWAGRAG